MSSVLFPQARLDTDTIVALTQELAKVGCTPVFGEKLFTKPEGGWATSAHDGWLMPGWAIDAAIGQVLNRFGIPALVVPLSNLNDDHPGRTFLTWHTPPNVDPRFPQGARHVEDADSDTGRGWLDDLPYQHTVQRICRFLTA